MRQTLSFAVETKEGAIQRIGKAYIVTPEIKFRGGEIKWVEEKYRDESAYKGEKR